ncbi:hypothetical protein B0H16DRAFT_1717597 [Mycena metata]|uniref:Uncharacterized protein n=1 Tax=Mycena metata TaxID=1033252 RepID=A0AAD7JIN9_9AGAR|nr:hypothetical protein B0H16DRAFT_1717597 [Mycena metata]
MAFVFMALFFVVEIFVAPDPILAPVMLRQKVPLLVGVSNFLSATCNFSINYFFPVWFQTVTLESASTAGLHMMPNSISMSTVGAVFAGWMMYKMGRYKAITIIFGILPFVGAVLISRMRKDDSESLQSWLSIIPLGFGNAVVLQSHRPAGTLAGYTGSRLIKPAATLFARCRRRNNALRAMRTRVAVGLRSVYIFAAGATLLAYPTRLPIPDMDLDAAYARQKQSPLFNGTIVTETPPDEEPGAKKKLIAAV